MRRTPLLVLSLVPVVAAACGDTGTGSDGGDRPTIAVTTDVLGDVVTNLVGDLAAVAVIVPPGSSPHEYQPSARQAAALREADAVVVNGAGFEEGLLPAVEGAEADGVPTIVAIDAVTPLGGEEPGEPDPHFFTDPRRMADAAPYIADRLVEEVADIDPAELDRRAEDYVDELRTLDAEVEELLAGIPADRRQLVTSHDIFSHFADRYGFQVVGTLVPSGTTQAQPSAGELDRLATVIAAEGIPAVFVEASAPADLARTVAAEVGADVEVVELHGESLGDEGSAAATYTGAVRTNAERIAEALGG
ncbi:MAG TPA: metal ABC transporter substrate-binding protein [Acidimicrobiales bacterium]